MKRRLYLMQQSTAKELADREFAAREAYRQKRYKLEKDIQDWEFKKQDWSNYLAAAGIPLGYWQGLQTQREKVGQANMLRRYLYGAQPSKFPRRNPLG